MVYSKKQGGKLTVMLENSIFGRFAHVLHGVNELLLTVDDYELQPSEVKEFLLCKNQLFVVECQLRVLDAEVSARRFINRIPEDRKEQKK